MDRLEKEYNEWLENVVIPEEDTDKLREDLKNELLFLSNMSVEEYTLYRKYLEIQKKYPIHDSNPFFTMENPYTELNIIKNNIWRPESPEDYLKLQPEVIWTMEDKDMTSIWTVLRIFCSTMLNNSNIGRNLRFVVRDSLTGKYLGVLCCSSDFMDLTPRDNYIGWSRDIKTTQKMINHTTIGSTIVPTQPLGFNYVGGKLLALLTISKVTEEAWNKRYGDKLVAYTTTSLYGSFSQYNGLKYWSKRGHSAGSIKFEPSQETVKRVRNWLMIHHNKKYWEWYHAKNEQGLPYKRDHKQRSLSFAYRQLGITKEYFETNHNRGIYFCPLFNNTCEFLRKEIGIDDLKRRFDNSIEHLVDIWKTKYASKRVKNLIKNNKWNDDVLFYDGMIGKDWKKVKEMYLIDVGR